MFMEEKMNFKNKKALKNGISQNTKSSKTKIICIIVFALYGIVNFILLFCHEPWRDEIHAWLMSKDLSVIDLIKESRFDGHPVLWHLILMPFAKLNFPIITLNVISYVIMLITVYLFLFKTNLNIVIKIIATLTVPFTYTYSVISRNYCLIALFLVIIAILYKYRFKKPILYSLPICLLIYTHSLAWGVVAGLTITFYFDEIIKFLKNRSNKADIKHVFVGLALIALNTIFVVLQLYGSSNVLYNVYFNKNLVINIVNISIILISIFIISMLSKRNGKELAILSITYAFQIIVYLTFYSFILYQREVLTFLFLLFYLMIVWESNEDFKNQIFRKIYICFFVLCVVLIEWSTFFDYVSSDFSCPFSSAIETANYIKNNIPEDATIFVDDPVIEQALIPYLDGKYELYDVENENLVDFANVSVNKEKVSEKLSNLEDYLGKYIIVYKYYYYDSLTESANLIFESKMSIMGEDFDIYYIPIE